MIAGMKMDIMANMEVHKTPIMVADMEVDMVADTEVDKMAYVVADIVAKRKWPTWWTEGEFLFEQKKHFRHQNTVFRPILTEFS